MVPKYNVTNIPDIFKFHIKNRITLLNLTKNQKNCKTSNFTRKNEKNNARRKNKIKIEMYDRRNTKNHQKQVKDKIKRC